MVISGKYELGELVCEGPVRTFRAKHLVLGHPLMVHFVSGGGSGNLANSMDRLSDEKKSFFTDAGDYDGLRYVVSRLLPDFDSLPAWLERAAGGSGPVRSAAEPPKSAGGGKAPSEFTRMFGAPNPEPPAEAKPAPPPSSSGEFTRLFGALHGLKTPSAPSPAKPSVPAQPLPPVTPPAHKTEAKPDSSEFNRYFQEPGSAPPGPGSAAKGTSGGLDDPFWQRPATPAPLPRPSPAPQAAPTVPGIYVSVPAPPAVPLTPGGGQVDYTMVVQGRPGQARPDHQPRSLQNGPRETAAPAKPGPPKSDFDERWYWLGLGVLALCAVALVLYFALRPAH